MTRRQWQIFWQIRPPQHILLAIAVAVLGTVVIVATIVREIVRVAL